MSVARRLARSAAERPEAVTTNMPHSPFQSFGTTWIAAAADRNQLARVDVGLKRQPADRLVPTVVQRGSSGPCVNTVQVRSGADLVRERSDGQGAAEVPWAPEL